MRSPEIGTILHWRPPDVHIFHTDPSLGKTLGISLSLGGWGCEVSIR